MRRREGTHNQGVRTRIRSYGAGRGWRGWIAIRGRCGESPRPSVVPGCRFAEGVRGRRGRGRRRFVESSAVPCGTERPSGRRIRVATNPSPRGKPSGCRKRFLRKIPARRRCRMRPLPFRRNEHVPAGTPCVGPEVSARWRWPRVVRGGRPRIGRGFWGDRRREVRKGGKGWRVRRGSRGLLSGDRIETRIRCVRGI